MKGRGNHSTYDPGRMRYRGVIALCVCILSVLPAANNADVFAAVENPASSRCEEPEASRIEKPAVKLENWPAGFEDGMYVLDPAAPRENARCTWLAVLTPAQSKVILNLALNPLGKPEFHLRFEKSNGELMARGMRPAKAELYGYWPLRGVEETGRGPDGRMQEENSSSFQPGGLVFAARPDLIQSTAAKNILLDPPQKLAKDIRAGRNYPWLEVFNLDEASRRYLLRACLEALRSGNPKIRLAGVETLGAMQSFQKDAAPPLIKAMRDPDKDVASYAAESLQVLGVLKTLPVPELADLLTSRNAGVRMEAARALESLGPGARDAVPALAKAASDRDMYVRQIAIQALIAAGFVDDTVVNALTAALSDRHASVQVAAAKALFKFNRALDKASGAMDGLLRSNDVNDRAWAAEALGFMGPAAVPRLARVLSDESLHVRERAYKALVAIGTQDARKTTAEYDATELSPRFWEKLVKLASESGTNRTALEPMLFRLRKGFLQWEPAACTAYARDTFILYKKPDLRDQVVDLSTAGKSYRISDFDMGYYPRVHITFLEYQDTLVRIRTDQGKEGWTRRNSFSCGGRLVADARGRVLEQLYPVPRILERERDVVFVSINGKPHLSFSSMDSQGQTFKGIAFEIDPGSLALVDVMLYDHRAMGPLKIGRWPREFPLNLFGGNCIGCFEIAGKVFLN